MKYLNKIIDAAHQKFLLTGENGERINMIIRYMPTQEAWFMDLNIDNFSLYGIRVVTSPNLLHKYKNTISFGIACKTDGNSEPHFINSFSSQMSKLYILNSKDVTTIEKVAFNV